VGGLRADLAENPMTERIMSSDQGMRGYKAASDAALGRGSQALTEWIADLKCEEGGCTPRLAAMPRLCPRLGVHPGPCSAGGNAAWANCAAVATIEKAGDADQVAIAALLREAR
jgi:hypothetical protein